KQRASFGMSGCTLVTGGAGFIGSHVVSALLAEGRQVRVLCKPGEDTRNLRGLSVDTIEGDIRESEVVRAALRGVDRVFHLAAVYALWTKTPGLMQSVNVEGTRNLLSQCQDMGVQRVVYTSSLAVFAGHGDCAANEESSFALGVTGSEYAQSKKDAHDVARSFVARGLDVVIAAPCGPIGPGDVGPTPTGRILLSALTDRIVFAVDFVSNMGDVRDMASGHLLVEKHGRSGESYLLGGHNVTMTELADIVWKHGRRKGALLKVPHALARTFAHPVAWFETRIRQRPPLFTPAEIRIAQLGLRVDCGKAMRELGYQCRPIETSVADAIAWFRQQGYT
ncbi:MAG TPA: NAD-dependent epimerase/dehydratase family protein, partial [Pseudomonadota bacterium]|nr:NAD-dependent epimerase/dehydratase family protein [Pseudomonadota bacterium]